MLMPQHGITTADTTEMSVPELTAEDLRSISIFTIDLARTAGALILEGASAMVKQSDVGEKKNSVDLVTEYDVKVERLVQEKIATTYPEFKL
jgi:myo-inositol-1(or 4)-monophosphatase